MSRLILRAALLGALATAPGAARPTEIGAVGAVNPLTTGLPPAAAEPRRLVIADRVVQDEFIRSGPDGAAQIMLLDRTTLTIGPSTEITLDRYIYDPERQSGEIGLSLLQGSLRFIGGLLTDEGEAEISAGEASVSVRGGVAHVSTEDAVTRVIFIAGRSARVAAGGETVTVSRPGAVVAVRPDATGRVAPVFEGVASPEEIAAAFQSLLTPGDGGARLGAGAGFAGAGTADARGAPSAPPIGADGRPSPDDAGELAGRVSPLLSPALIAAASPVPEMSGPPSPPPDEIFGDVSAVLPLGFVVADIAAIDGDTVAIEVFDREGLQLSIPSFTMPDDVAALSDLETFAFLPEVAPGLVQIRLTALNEGASSPNTGGVFILPASPGAPPDAIFNLRTGERGTLLVDAVPATD